MSHLSDFLLYAPQPAESVVHDSTKDAVSSHLSVKVVTAVSELMAYAQDISDLAADATELNVFYEPAVLFPSLRHFGSDKHFLFVLVYRSDSDARDELCGFVPLEIRNRYRGLPIRAARLWDYLHLHTCSPLLRRGCEQQALESFLRWFDERRELSLLDLSYVGAAGMFGKTLRECLRARAYAETVSYERAFLRRKHSADEYLAGTLRGVKRKELRRQLRRLGERGNLEFRDTGADTLEQDIDEFLLLEKMGWKGREGTALACSEARSAFFREMARNAFAKGQLMLLTMRLNGEAIAAKCNLLTGSGGYTFKIAFDESYADYSPGTQLEIECIRRIHHESRTEWLDSCAAPGHFMAERLWAERKAVQTVVIANGAFGTAFVLFLPLARWARRGMGRLKRYFFKEQIHVSNIC